MSRIDAAFGRAKKEGRAALIGYVTAGDPNLAESEALVLALAESGVDIFEIGIPFSDPFADGIAIQDAMVRARAAGTTLIEVFNLCARLRKRIEQPMVLFGYYNPIFVFGEQRFADAAKAAGADGLLMVDLPPEEAGALGGHLAKNGMNLVPLLAPTSTPDRIAAAASVASGFIYYVSMTGITGAKLDDLETVRKNVTALRKSISIPISVGFGIKEPSQAQQIAQYADGVVVGSALVAAMQKDGPAGAAAAARAFAAALYRTGKA